jgi:hypothetical protein
MAASSARDFMAAPSAGFARAILLLEEAGRSTPKACDDRRKGTVEAPSEV